MWQIPEELSHLVPTNIPENFYTTPSVPEIEPGQPIASAPSSVPSENQEIGKNSIQNFKDNKVTIVPEWHGYMVNQEELNKELYVGWHDGKLRLYEVEGDKRTILVTFRSEETARKVLDWLDILTAIFVKTSYDK